MTDSIKAIETDQDTADEDKVEQDGGLYPYDPAYSTIEIETLQFSIFEYLRQLEKGKIIVQPDFQRNQVWTPSQKSKFIESVILNFPLPPVYLNETVEGKYVVIDGLQRTTALEQFYKGKFELTGIEALPKYNTLDFDSIPESLKSKIEDKKLTVFVLKPSTPMVVIYDLFNRINTGGTQLNRQEVRNCIFIGNSTRLLKELSEQEYFKRAIDYGVKSSRMKDRELVLRYLAFRWPTLSSDYNGDMSGFVENAMKKINRTGDSQITELKDDFARVCKWSFTIWAKRNFRIPTAETRGTINIAIFETICKYLSSKSDDFLERNKSKISLNYDELISDETYYDAVTRATGGKQKVSDRFRIVHEILDKETI